MNKQDFDDLNDYLNSFDPPRHAGGFVVFHGHLGFDRDREYLSPELFAQLERHPELIGAQEVRMVHGSQQAWLYEAKPVDVKRYEDILNAFQPSVGFTYSKWLGDAIEYHMTDPDGFTGIEIKGDDDDTSDD